MAFPLLSIIVFLPLLGAVVLAGVPREHVNALRWGALVTMLVTFGAFLALDLFLFFIFWEAMLIPMYLIIGIWGGENRLYATVKFILYTMAGSALMLVAILALYVFNQKFSGQLSFDLLDLYSVPLSL